VVEGAEFLLTHRHIVGRHLVHFLAAAACAFGALWLRPWIAAVLPPVPAVTFPWYLVLLEWLWAELPSLLAAEVSAWSATAAYLALPSTGRLIAAVMAHRGEAEPCLAASHEPGGALAWLAAGAAAYAAIAWIPLVGPASAVVLACPVLGAGFVITVLERHGWSGGAVRAFATSHWPLLSGVGLGLIVGLVIPVFNLAALPCAVAGTVCLLRREVGAVRVRTTGGTIPYASPDRRRSPR
jgi:hypothetical protein